MQLPVKVHIKENSWLARLAAKQLKGNSAAIVFGNTIYLHGISQQSFLQNETWVKHELKHVAQFRQYGFMVFIFKYLVESYKNGYYYNRFEVEAREAEQL